MPRPPPATGRDDPASDAMLAVAPFIIGQRKPDDPFYDREAMR